MTTIADALQNSADALDRATQGVLATRDAIAAQLVAAKTASQVTINNFLARPAVQTYYLDPANGSETNDGLTIDTPKKLLDPIVVGANGASLKICLLNDLLVQNRLTVFGSLTIIGMQKASNANGFVVVQRRLSFLGTALNSPDLGNNWTYGAGFFVGGVNFSTYAIDFYLADQPAGQTFSAHVQASSTGTAFSIVLGTVLVASANAGKLLGANNAKSNAYLAVTLGANAAGHLFDGVSAGGNPNTLFQYTSNVTSA